MIEFPEQATDRALRLLPEARDEIARIVPAYAGDDRGVSHLTPGEEASFTEAPAQAARRQSVTAEQAGAARAKHGRRSGA